ncbi:hypothetical protein C5167_023576 [Papaver somniferum]|uniref:Xylanase inhibitor N-terminal domain-containing protein n=1 Tax=Papaver somniferum TaxID=3469 RepID=A0A4Y7JP28_PAPSO|nr:hypothetical protein C5167_023576 [Papaver somniferum]
MGLGLGPGDISILSSLAKAGLAPNSFSMCFDDDDFGRIFLGTKELHLKNPHLSCRWMGKLMPTWLKWRVVE